MAGHSKFKNIVHRKNLQDKKRALNSTRIIREISIAAKFGIDPKINFRLRVAIANARKNNVSKDTLENAIKKASGDRNLSSEYDDIMYEGYGPLGIAILIDTLTNNRNRTSGEIRTIFNKHGGSLGTSGSASYLFDRTAVITYDVDFVQNEKVMEELVNIGITDYYRDEGKTVLESDTKDSEKIREYLEKIGYHADNLEVIWKPKQYVVFDKVEDIEKISNFLSILDESDDVYSVSTNLDPKVLLQHA